MTFKCILTSILINFQTLDELVDKILPKDIRLNRDLKLDEPMSIYIHTLIY